MEPAGEEATNGAAPAASLRSRPLLHYKELSLGAPNKKTKFTSVHASENFLACGASNGSVFLYVTSVNRADATESKRAFPSKYHLVKTIAPPHGTNDRASVSCLTICPQQKRLVVGTIGGVVYGIQLTDYNKIGERVEFTHDFHTGFPVTCFLWDKLGMKLYSACNGGMVAQTSLRAGMSAFFGKADTELLLKEETGIVQLDMAKYGKADILMVSSQVRVLLLNLTSADGSAVQIGTKPRQGNFGACFFTGAADEAEVTKKTNVKVFSSRPGRRVWVADPQTGTVSATLKFALGKNPTTFLQGPDCQSNEAIQSRDLTVNKLALFQFIHDPYAADDSSDSSLLVSWNAGSSVLFFLDPIAVEIVEWHLDMGTIHDLKVLNESVLIVLHGDPPKVSIVESCSARQFLDIYAMGNVKKSVEMAIEYQMNDASLVDNLQTQWKKLLDGSQDETMVELSSQLELLHQNVKELEERRRVPDLNSSMAATAAPLQVIFKQRPQQQQSTGSTAPNLFASNTSGGNKAEPQTASDYLDLRPSPLSYRRNIYTPDGSTLEAQLIEIKELPSTEPIVRDDYRESWMEDIMEEVRKFEAYKAENEGAMNMLPTLRGTLNNTGAAAKAITTYIPGATMISSLMDTATNVNYGARGSAMGIFGDLPGADETLILDPIQVKKPTHAVDDAHECAVLRIAMSATGESDASADTEVLLEAISMDIWDSKLKYISNLPLEKQLSLPEAVAEDEEKKRPASPWARNGKPQGISPMHRDRPVSAEKKSPLRRSKSAESLEIDVSAPPLSLGNGDDLAQLSARRLQRLTRRSSLSPDTGRSAQRALLRHIGGGPSCDFQRKCLVRGQLATAPELDSILKREVSDLMAELQSAATTAEKSARLTRRLWPAAGITRVCGCLTNMFLYEGDLPQAQKAIRAWLTCFDPTAKPEEQHRSPTAAKQKEMASMNKNGSKTPGFARGEALIDGDGLPLTRSDWTLVRVMVSTYFAISAAGSALRVRPATPHDYSSDKVRSYAYEMGIVLEVRQDESDSSKNESGVSSWTANEAEAFVKKYGIYLNTELAAEICNKKRMGNVLNAVLDQVVSSSNMSSTCDDVVNWIVEKQVKKALECLHDMDSLCLLLHVLDLLLKKCSDEAIELCVANFPALTPWNVERCLFGDQSSASYPVQELLRPENIPQTAKYFHYLVRLMEDHADVVGQDAILVNRCLQLCFGGSKVVGKTFERKKTGSNDVISWFCSVLKRPRRYTYDHTKAWELCVKNHVYIGVLELTFQSLAKEPKSEKGQHELDHLVQHVVKKKELLLLEKLLSRSTAVCEDIAAGVIEKILNHIESAAETGDEELITTVVHALLNAVGPSEGMRRLARFPLLFSASPLAMYQTIVEAHLLDQRQDEELNFLLETMDTHVWAAYKQASMSNEVSFPPQVEAVFELERGTLKTPLDEAKYEKWRTKQVKYEAELEKHRRDEKQPGDYTAMDTRSLSLWDTVAARNAQQVSRCYETRSSDWGGEVQLHDATCAVCDLPVVIIADDNCNMEVALLPCGHAFHTVCATDAACPVCFESNFDSLADEVW